MPGDETDSPTAGRTTGGRRLSRERIVRTAIELIDEQGIGAVSMRVLAGRLGVEAMSLYKHIGNRDQLLDAVAERIVGELAEDDDVPRSPAGRDWQPYLAGLARGIRRYARSHPHAFPIVATRPTDAPWINPPLRSVEWIEAFLHSLREAGFSDDQTLFAYRSFNSFLLGFLLLETSAMTIHEPAPGDGAYSRSEDGDEPGNADDPVPGGLTPARSRADRETVAEANSPTELINPQDTIDRERYPTVHELAQGLAEDHFEAEFEQGLQAMLTQIAGQLA